MGAVPPDTAVQCVHDNHSSYKINGHVMAMLYTDRLIHVIITAVGGHQHVLIYLVYPAAQSIVTVAPVCSAILFITFDLPRKNDNEHRHFFITSIYQVTYACLTKYGNEQK